MYLVRHSSASLRTTRSLIHDSEAFDTLLGGGLSTYLAQDVPQTKALSFSAQMDVFYSGDSEDTRRLGHIYTSKSLDDYVDDYVVLREDSAITALRTR